MSESITCFNQLVYLIDFEVEDNQNAFHAFLYDVVLQFDI